MTSTAARIRGPLAPSAPALLARAQVRMAREAVAVAAAAAVAAGLCVATWLAWGDLLRDTGYDWVAADRLAAGALPYVDYPYYYGPLGLALLAGAFAVNGTSAATAVAVGLGLAVVSLVLTYVVARAVSAPWPAAAATALAAGAAFGVGNKNLVVPHAISAAVAVVVGLCLVAAVAAHARTGGRGSLLAVGASVGATTLTRPEFVLAAVTAVALWLVLRARTGTAVRRREAALVAGAAVVPPLLVYGALLTRIGPAELLRDNLAASDQLSSGAAALLRVSAPLTAGSVAQLALHLLVYALLAAGLIALATLLSAGGRRRAIGLLAVAGAAVALAGLLVAHPEAVRGRMGWAFAWIPAGAAIAVLLLAATARRHRRAWSPRDQVALVLAALLLVLAGKTYAAFLPHPSPLRAQSAVYAMPFAAAFLAWLHHSAIGSRGPAVRALGLAWMLALAVTCSVLTVRDGARETATVSGPGGSLRAPVADAAALQPALEAVATRTRPGEPVLFAPQLSALYVLADRPDPVPDISLLPGALDRGRGSATLARRVGGLRVAVIDTRARVEYGHGAFGETFQRDLARWLDRRLPHRMVLAHPDSSIELRWRKTQ